MGGRGAVESLRARQRQAIWKWRWLGWRDSTPAFKGSLAILAIAAAVLAVMATR